MARASGGAKLGNESVDRLQDAIDLIPARLISQRAVDCNEYARALFHLEQYTREVQATSKDEAEKTELLEQLQDIYAHIDEPDGLEGISAQLHVLDINQQILSHRKAGRWTAAQTWYEIQLAEDPNNTDIQVDLLTCLKQSGQHGMFWLAATPNVLLTIRRRAPQLRRRYPRDARHGEQDRALCGGSGMGNRPMGHHAKVQGYVLGQHPGKL